METWLSGYTLTITGFSVKQVSMYTIGSRLDSTFPAHLPTVARSPRESSDLQGIKATALYCSSTFSLPLPFIVKLASNIMTLW